MLEQRSMTSRHQIHSAMSKDIFNIRYCVKLVFLNGLGKQKKANIINAD